MSAAKLFPPSVECRDSYLDAVREYHAEGCYKDVDISKVYEDFEGFVARLADPKNQAWRLPDWAKYVPETRLWLVKDDTYIGSVSIRHRLNWHLEKFGGNIGYIIRPSWRGKGFGKKILRLALPVARHLGIDRALITCAPDNAAARRVIEANGGVYHDEVPGTAQHPPRLRFWIDLGE